MGGIIFFIGYYSPLLVLVAILLLGGLLNGCGYRLRECGIRFAELLCRRVAGRKKKKKLNAFVLDSGSIGTTQV